MYSSAAEMILGGRIRRRHCVSHPLSSAAEDLGRLLQRRHVAAVLDDHQPRVGDVGRHLPGARQRQGHVLASDDDDGRQVDLDQQRRLSARAIIAVCSRQKPSAPTSAAMSRIGCTTAGRRGGCDARGWAAATVARHGSGRAWSARSCRGGARSMASGVSGAACVSMRASRSTRCGARRRISNAT